MNNDDIGINNNTIDLPNESKLTEEFQLITKRMNKILNQTEFEINNGEYIYKEHCNEIFSYQRLMDLLLFSIINKLIYFKKMTNKI